MRFTLVQFWLLVISYWAGAASASNYPKIYRFDIKTTNAEQALEQIAKKTGFNLFYHSEKINDLTTPRIKGAYTLEQVLQALLKDSRLEAVLTSKKVIVLKSRANPQPIEVEPPETSLFDRFLGLFASQPRSTDADQGVEVIEVRGSRGSFSRSLNQKRYNQQLVDAISIDDAGVMPDPDIGDSLQRVTGVQVQRGENGVARNVSVRGLPGHMTQVNFNGNQVNTPINDNRNFSFQIIPTTFVASAVVEKTVDAAVNEGGIAGTVNLQTYSGLLNESFTKVLTQSSYQGNNGEYGNEVSFIHTNANDAHSLGLAIGFNRLRQNIGNQLTTSSNPDTRAYREQALGLDLNSDGDHDDILYSPNQIRIQHQESERERDAYFFDLEWQPNDAFSVDANALYVNYHKTENRDRFVFTPKANSDLNPAELTITQANGHDYISVLSGQNITATVDSTPVDRDSKILSAGLTAQLNLGAWEWQLKANLAESEMVWNSVLLQSKLAGLDVSINGLTGGPFAFYYADPTATAQTLLDTASYGAQTLNAVQLNTVQNNNSEQLALYGSYYLSKSFFGMQLDKFSFGVSRLEEELLKLRPSAKLTANQLAELNGANGYQFTFDTVEVERGHWFDGNTETQSPPLPWLSPDIDDFLSTYSYQDLETITKAKGSYKAGSREDLLEQTTAAFVKLDFARDETFSGNIGLRWLKGQQQVISVGADLSQGLVLSTEGYALVEQDLETERKRSYQYWLPSINLLYSPNPAHQWRFSWGKNLSRPDKADVLNLTEFDAEQALLSTSNPNIQPFRATSSDVSYSWFFAPQSMLSVAIFHKELATLVAEQEYQLTLPVFDQAQNRIQDISVDSFGKTNVDGVSLSGFEFGYMQPFDFLPGLWANTGVNFNYTYIDNDNEQRLVAASKDNFNLALYYNDHQFDARLAYSYRGEYLKSQASGTTPATFFDEAKYLTASISYYPAQNIRLSVSMSNVTDEATNIYNGNGSSRAFNDFGQRFNVSLDLQF